MPPRDYCVYKEGVKYMKYDYYELIKTESEGLVEMGVFYHDAILNALKWKASIYSCFRHSSKRSIEGINELINDLKRADASIARWREIANEIDRTR